MKNTTEYFQIKIILDQKEIYLELVKIFIRELRNSAIVEE